MSHVVLVPRRCIWPVAWLACPSLLPRSHADPSPALLVDHPLQCRCSRAPRPPTTRTSRPPPPTLSRFPLALIAFLLLLFLFVRVCFLDPLFAGVARRILCCLCQLTPWFELAHSRCCSLLRLQYARVFADGSLDTWLTAYLGTLDVSPACPVCRSHRVWCFFGGCGLAVLMFVVLSFRPGHRCHHSQPLAGLAHRHSRAGTLALLKQPGCSFCAVVVPFQVQSSAGDSTSAVQYVTVLSAAPLAPQPR